MGMSRGQSARAVSISCPACYSGNYFELGPAGAELTCDDCGFVLAGARGLTAADSGRCVVCGGEYFYAESTFSLPFLRKRAVCYVCEAEYEGGTVGILDRSYNPDTEAKARRSEAAQGLRQRVELYPQDAG